MTSQQTIVWRSVGVVAAVQLIGAFAAVSASGQDPLSPVACLLGVFGTLAHVLVLILICLSLLIFLFGYLRSRTLHRLAKPAFVLGLSSGLAILIGSQAALRCTV